MGGMNKSTKMLLMREGGSGNRGGNRGGNQGGRMEYGGMNYEPEDRFRDRRGREHYDNGRFAPMRSEGDYGGERRYEGGNMGYGAEMRGEGRGGRGGRGGNSGAQNEYEMEGRRGRRRGARSEYEGARNEEEEFWNPSPPPVYEDGETMNRIGFEQRSNVLMLPMGNMGGKQGEMERGHGGAKNFREEMAEEWTKGMHNEDGSRGPHWKMEDVQKLMKQRGIQTDPNEFFAVLNAVYSDYCGVAKKHGVNTMDFYVDFALAWLNDKDAVPNKAAAYYEHIVK